MALIKTANLLIDIRGSVGGSVYSRDTSGLHLVSPKRKVYRRSPLQDRRRRAFLTAKNTWRTDVTYNTRFLWAAYSRRHPTKNRIGEPITLSAYQMFMRFNIYRAYNNVSLISTPPEG